MRTFKLWNKQKSASYDLSAGALVSDVKGLGLKFNKIRTNGVVTAVETTYDPITLGLNFGHDANAYTAFNTFMNFIRDNGRNKFILEYQVNNRTLYADVWMTSIPKSQKTSYNLIQETLELERETHWYTIESETIPADPSVLTITNPVDDQIPTIITIQGSTSGGLTIEHTDADDNPIGNVVLAEDVFLAQTLEINGLTKKLNLTVSSGEVVNGYFKINKAADTFIVLNPGVNKLRISLGAAASVTLDYRQWVID